MRTSGLFGALLSIALPLVAANPLNAAVLGRAPGIDEVARRTPGDLARRATVSGPYMNAAFIHYVGGPHACGPINSNFFVALDASQFGTGFPGPNCNVPITVQVGSHSMTAVILDVCVECGENGLAMSNALFEYFAPLYDLVLYGTWSVDNASASD
ncbi:hypothetical protein BKA93DRAFT_826698 [Sparassis latifolia]